MVNKLKVKHFTRYLFTIFIISCWRHHPGSVQGLMETLYDLVRRSIETYIAPYSSHLRTAWFGLAIIAFGILSSGKSTASYGRHYSKSSIIPSVNGKLGWMCMEIVSPAAILLFFQTYKLPGPFLSTG